MPMFVWCDRNIDWGIWDTWPQAAVGATPIVMRDPVFCNDAQVVFSQWNEEIQAFSAECTDDPFTEAVSLGGFEVAF